uniref:Uncharacterized protein n=1 Tax=Avena sativa TaxID=4498 RepID=A0ACD6A055_AVESA
MKRVYLLSTHLLVLGLVSSSFVAESANDNETDMSALMSFKSFITGDPLRALSSWNSSHHHCEWQGVICGRRHPERVTALVLPAQQLSGHISLSLANLTFLKKLDLRQNRLIGSIPEDLGRLSRLKLLNLSLNSLHGRIPSSLSNCSNLEFLHLKDNSLQGTIPPSLTQYCRHLKFLSLKGNRLLGSIPESLGNLTNAVTIDLSHNTVSGSIPSSLGELQFLQFFYIIGNNVTGKIPHSIYNISSMINLELGDNKLEGILPPEIFNGFSNLKKLYLWGNYFKGQIPVSLSNCSSLAHIDLQFNNFTGPLPSSIGKLKSLYWLAVNSNQLEANKPRDWGFIDSMTNCTNLQLFDISNNRLRGVIPNTIANFSASIYYLRVSANPISGSIPKGIAALTNLTTLGIDQTFLGGIIPKEFGRLQNLQLLSLSNNMMVGEVPATLALAVFDISNNNLVGAIPKEIISLPSLSIGINFSHNHLNGSLPLEIGFLKNIETIDLSNNKLSGEIPTTIDGCQILRNLYIGRNMMSGTIPSTLRNMRGLQVLDLSRNSFSGEVPQFMTRMALQLLNISFNNFEGQLPSEGVFMNLSTVDIRGNPKLCGGAPEIHLRKCSLDTPTHRHIPRSILVTLLSIAGAFLCLISMMLCFLSHRHSLRRLQRRKHAITVMTPQHMNISYHDLLKATSGFSSENVIGMGGFGVVYKGVMAVEGLSTSVAVKVINLEQRGASRSFLSECETLRSVRHRNLIKVLSCCSSIDQRGNEFKALVFEYMPNGSLEEWLHPKESMDQQPFESLGITQRLNIAIDVAEALDYLHEHGPGPVVHCDLKPSNILLDNEMIAHVRFWISEIFDSTRDHDLSIHDKHGWNQGFDWLHSSRVRIWE